MLRKKCPNCGSKKDIIVEFEFVLFTDTKDDWTFLFKRGYCENCGVDLPYEFFKDLELKLHKRMGGKKAVKRYLEAEKL